MADTLIPLTTEASDLLGDSREMKGCYDNGILKPKHSLDRLPHYPSQPDAKSETPASEEPPPPAFLYAMHFFHFLLAPICST